MAYWDNTTTTPTIITKKRIWRIEIFGDLDGNFEFVAHIDRVKTEDGVELPPESLGDVRTTYDVAFADVVLEPQITKIKNGCKALVRELRKA